MPGASKSICRSNNSRSCCTQRRFKIHQSREIRKFQQHVPCVVARAQKNLRFNRKGLSIVDRIVCSSSARSERTPSKATELYVPSTSLSVFKPCPRALLFF